MRLPTAAPVPRVPRSRRDDRFVMAHPLCPKLGGVGIVSSRQGDTVTVLISDEEITGVIPLTSIPPVGAIVEVESRCDLMVILDWQAGDLPQPQLGEWYFTASESPGWSEGESDSPVGAGERVTNPAPIEGPGILWNTLELRVRPGDTLTFAALLSKMEPSDTIAATLVMMWTEYGADPQPSNGEIVAYGATVLVGSEAVEFSASVVVPADYDIPPGGGSRRATGQARLGIRFEAAP